MVSRRGEASDGTLSPIGVEALDVPSLDHETARATLGDIATANLLFGGRAAVVWGVEAVLRSASRPGTLRILDVGAGLGDVLAHLRRRLEGSGIRVTPVALDWHTAAVMGSRAQRLGAVEGDALSLPFADGSVDIVIASQLLHHFSRPAALRVVGELNRVSRIGVVVADLRRTTLARWGIWMAAVLLRFHRVSRRDGVLSVRRGFTPAELEALARDAAVPAVVRRRPGFRLVAYWSTVGANG